MEASLRERQQSLEDYQRGRGRGKDQWGSATSAEESSRGEASPPLGSFLEAEEEGPSGRGLRAAEEAVSAHRIGLVNSQRQKSTLRGRRAQALLSSLALFQHSGGTVGKEGEMGEDGPEEGGEEAGSMEELQVQVG